MLLLQSFASLTAEARVSEEVLQQECRAMESIDSKMWLHVCPIVMLAHSRTNLPAKFRVFVHTLALLSDSPETLVQLVRSISSVHTDYGVESGIARMPPIPLEDILPHWHSGPEPEHHLNDDCFVESGELQHVADDMFQGDEPPRQHLIDLSCSLEGPDMMHVIHNATNDLSTVADTYPDMLQKLTVLLKLMSNKETKQQLLTGCFSQGDAHAFYNQIAAVSHTVHEKRWNTIATAIELAADLEVALRAGWDLDDFMRGRKPPSSRQEDTSPAVAFGVNLQQVDEAIHSDFFWASIKVFLEVARVQRQAVRFVTSCPCHYGLSRTGVDQAVLDKWDSCPMRGRRCPEICGGDFFAMMQETMQAGSVSLEMQLPRSLSQEEKLKLLRDFELSRQMLLTTYVVKLSFWSQAPFAVVGIAHHDPAIRMKSCVTCLQSKSDHPKIQLLQKHEDVVRAFLVAGCLWDETGAFNVLKELAAEVRLFFSTAWRVEGQHAKTRRAVDHAPCRSAAFVSFLHRKLEFAAHLRAHPEAAVEVAELMGRALNGVAAAKALGFSVAAMEKSAWFNWGKQKSSFRYIYHDDPYLKYVLPLPPSWKRVLPERLLSQPDMVLPQGSCLLRWTLAQQHIKQHANRGCYMSVKYNPHLLYSVRSILAPDEDGAILRVQDGNLLGDDFDEVGQAGRLNALPCPQHQLVSLKAFLEGAGDVAEEVMFFSLMHKSPQRYHRTKTVSEVSLKDSWFVQLHDILAMRPEKKEVLVSLQGVALGPTATDKWEDAPLALHVAHLDLASLKAMWLWEVDASAAVHRFDNQMMSTIPQQMHERLETLLQQLVGSNSLCGRPEEDPAIAELLDILVSESLVEGPPWKLTPTGAERTRQAVRLWNEVPLLRRTEKPLSEASLYQLVLELDAAGFTHEVVTASKHKKLKKQQSPHLQEGQKMWFTRSDDVTVCRSYVLALLSCPVEQVPYAAAEKEYLRLLGLEQTPALGNKKGKRKRLHVNDDWPDDALSQPRARVPRTRRSAAASRREQQHDPIDDALSQLGGDSDVPADEDDNVEEGVSSHDEDSSASSSSNSSSSSSSSSNTNSSSSSSSSSSARASGSQAPAAPGANGGPGAAAVAKAAAAPALKRQGRGYLWGDHLLTPVGDDDANPQHWQIRCGDPLHNLAGHACTKKRSCRYGGSERVQHVLKYWASLSSRYESAEQHLQGWTDDVLPMLNANTIPNDINP